MNVRSYKDLAYLPVPAIDPGITAVRAPTTGEKRPWDIFFGADDRGNAVLKVYPGTINGILPSNILDDFKISNGQTNYIIAYIKGGPRGNVTDVVLKSTTKLPKAEAPTESAPPSTFGFLVGMAKDQTTYSIYSGTSSINLNVKEVFRQQIKVSTFFEVPFKSYYNWVKS
jgi:hypothetical protein